MHAKYNITLYVTIVVRGIRGGAHTFCIMTAGYATYTQCFAPQIRCAQPLLCLIFIDSSAEIMRLANRIMHER